MDIFAELTQKLRKQNFDQFTTHTYLYWVRRFLFYHGCRNPKTLKPYHLHRFMEHLQDNENANLATRQQANQAITFLFENLLVNPVKKSPASSHRLRRRDIQNLFGKLEGVYWLMAALIYGSGLRSLECVSLRIKDLHLENECISLSDPTLSRGRKVVLDDNLVPTIKVHMGKIRSQHILDLSQGDGYVRLPCSTQGKPPKYSRDWQWQFVFPSSLPLTMENSTARHRPHLADQVLEQQLTIASQAANLIEPANCLSLRRSFASHLGEKGYSLAAIQQQLGHEHPSQALLFEDHLEKPVLSPLSETLNLQAKHSKMTEADDNKIQEPCALYQVA